MITSCRSHGFFSLQRNPCNPRERVLVIESTPPHFSKIIQDTLTPWMRSRVRFISLKGVIFSVSSHVKFQQILNNKDQHEPEAIIMSLKLEEIKTLRISRYLADTATLCEHPKLTCHHICTTFLHDGRRFEEILSLENIRAMISTIAVDKIHQKSIQHFTTLEIFEHFILRHKVSINQS